MNCLNCGAENIPTNQYCTTCGAKLERFSNEINSNICPNCGYENEEGSKFCISCGNKILEKEEPKNKTCEACGYVNTLESTYCYSCGQKLQEVKVEPSVNRDNLYNALLEQEKQKKQTTALVLGIISLIVSIYGVIIPFIGQILAIVLGVIALVLGIYTVKLGGPKSILAIIFGIVGICIGLIIIVIYIAFASAFPFFDESYYDGYQDGDYYMVLINYLKIIFMK